MTTLQNEILEYRAKHRLSQAKFADMCGLNVMTINTVERGLQTPSRLTEAKIRMVLDADKEER